jgi:hypothetical protein
MKIDMQLTTQNVFYKPIFFLALLTPLMPKIKIVEGVYMYLLEFFLFLLLPLFFYNPSIYLKFRLQRLLLLMWTIILLSTLVSIFDVPSFIGLAKVIKEIVYIPLAYIAYIYFRDKSDEAIVLFIKFGILAIILNIIYYIYTSYLYGYTIWDMKAISSGFSNKYFDLHTGTINLIQSGSHGIWGHYCVLIFVYALVARYYNIINLKLFYIASVLCVVSIAISVSRASFIVFSFVLLGLIGSAYKGKGFLSGKVLNWLLFGTLIFIPLIIVFSENISILSKLSYTFDSFVEKGTESNIQLRINTWLSILASFLKEPMNLLLGYGYNPVRFYEILQASASEIGVYSFVSVPESLYMLALSYGGIGSLTCILFFSFFLLKLVFANNFRDRLLFFYFFGLLSVNFISGASLISDLLYGQILILIGFLYSRRNTLTQKQAK